MVIAAFGLPRTIRLVSMAGDNFVAAAVVTGFGWVALFAAASALTEDADGVLAASRAMSEASAPRLLANVRAVDLSLPALAASAPLSSNIFTMASSFRYAAHIRAVQPRLSSRSGAAPAPSNMVAASWLPVWAAAISGVMSFLLAAFTSDLFSSKRRMAAVFLSC